MVGVDTWWSCDVMWSGFQWSESLELVAHGLKENGVQFLHGKDPKSLQVWAPPTILIVNFYVSCLDSPFVFLSNKITLCLTHRNRYISLKRMMVLRCCCCQLIPAQGVSISPKLLMWSYVSRHWTWPMNIKPLDVFIVWAKQSKYRMREIFGGVKYWRMHISLTFGW